MSANANLLDLVTNLNLDYLTDVKHVIDTAKQLSSSAQFATEREAFLNQKLSHFERECPNAEIDIKIEAARYRELCDNNEKFNPDLFAKLMILKDIYANNQEILKKLHLLDIIQSAVLKAKEDNPSAPRENHLRDPILVGIEEDANKSKILNEVVEFLRSFPHVEFLRPFRHYEPHVNRKIERKKGSEACDFIVLLLKSNDSAVDEAEKKKAEEKNIPIFIRRSNRWSVYGLVNGKWQERALENLTTEENRGLQKILCLNLDGRLDSQNIANQRHFPLELKTRLRNLHSYSTSISCNDLESDIERMLNDIKEGSSETDLMNNDIKTKVASLINDLKDTVEDRELTWVNKLKGIYNIYRHGITALQPDIRAFLYPDNQPSIEELRINVEGERHKTLGAYLRGKVAPGDIDHFNDEHIKERLIASYLKMCIFSINPEVIGSLRHTGFPNQYVELIEYAFREVSRDIGEEEFLKTVNSYAMRPETRVAWETAYRSLLEVLDKDLEEASELLKKHHPKLHKKMKKVKGGDIKALEEKISYLKNLMKGQDIHPSLSEKMGTINSDWAEMENFRRDQEALKKLEHDVSPQISEESPSLNISQKKGGWGLFSRAKTAIDTKTHPQSVPLLSPHVSAAAAKKAVSLPVSAPRQPAPDATAASEKLPPTPNSSSSSTAVLATPPGLLSYPTASPSAISSSNRGFGIKTSSSSAGSTPVVSGNPIISPNAPNGASALVGAELTFVPVDETAVVPTNTPLFGQHRSGPSSPATSSGPSMFRPVTPPANGTNRGTEIISENQRYIDIDMDEDTISEDLSHREMGPRQ